ncbi:MAG: DUF981 domain-containing protein [Candidatus Thermoplasmatota archaeon]|jgi:uncharacterized membrane protein|nr:DUF981 domain-containing protein [Candidatus Thermoplasmatota archaeon]MCL5789849.1 DUF981 domain-containing protein [Candidatus Thermoplasmatota archaeon]
MAWLFTDPLAANLFVVGIMFASFGSYAIYRFLFGRNKPEINMGFSYLLIATGLYALLYGVLYSVIVPTPFTVADGELFGDPLVILGVASILVGIMMSRKVSLAFAGIFTFFGGILGVVYAIDGYRLGMSSPLYILLLYLGAGIGGMLTAPLVVLPNKKAVQVLAILVAIAFLGVAILAFIIGTTAIGGHLVDFAKATA